MRNVIGVVASVAYIVGVLAFSSKMKYFGLEFSRKFAHMMVANWWFIGNYIFDNVIACSTVPIIIGTVMALSYKYSWFDGVERPGQKKSFGTVYYFISLLILVNISFRLYGNMIPMGIYFMPLGYGDGMAALVGKKFHKGIYNVRGSQKSVSGSLAMFLVSFMTMYGYSVIYDLNYSVQKLLALSVAAAVIEAVSIKGSDNITIPLGTYIVSFII